MSEAAAENMTIDYIIHDVMENRWFNIMVLLFSCVYGIINSR